ncbi:DNA methylase [Faecalitalea cylindroides T2-87]|uniref:DNA methylase n=1 Tax=Faecalitalea cylindroides T2-87 TaxID=717960 RepID=D4JDH5_9FIRM|nr:DNA methylase [Faecalitalea cylindroides T2-87]
MARRYETITELYSKTVAGLAAPQAWQSFLTTACHNFRLPFDEQVLLYAQRPDATAVLPIEGKNGWNQRFGRWVNRGATGIAVFDGDAVGRSRLKYYFDISDTHESRFARPVPIWTMRPEYEPAVIEALENSFGELEDKTDLAAALLSAAKNATQDNMPDYLTELKYYKENSFLEELDDLNIEVEYRRALENSIGYMLLARCGIDPAGYFTDDDFRDVVDFSTPETLNALGTATGDIGQMCLSAVSRTAHTLQRQAERETHTFAEKPTIQYPDAEKKTTTHERSEPYERTDIHDAGRLPAAESASAPGAGNAPWEIRIAAEDIPETAPQSDLHEPADIGQAEPAPNGDRAGVPLPDGTADQPDGESRGRDGGTESQRSDEVDGADEQHPALSGGDSPERADLQLNTEPIENAGGDELPAFLDDKLIMAIISNKDDDLKYKKQQIELYFSIHPEETDRAEYLKSAYQDRYTEILVDGVRVGYKPQADGLLMWAGAYLSRTSESVFSWSVVAGWTAQLIDKKEYFINTKITPPKSYDSQQLSLFDFADFQAPGREESGQLSFMPRPQLSQQVIDEAFCIGANERNSRLIICAYFMKDHTPEENAAFLAKHYGTNGAGFYINERKYSIWYGEEGIRISDGESAQRRYATLLTWEQAARRIRELLDLGRYMPQSELDRVVEYERKTLAESLALTARDFSEEARGTGYAPTLRLALSAKGGFPEIEQQISELLKDPDTLQRITEEWGEFVAAHEQNRNLMRFGYNRPKELLQKLTDLQREPVTFTAAEDYNPQRRFFISMDEIDKVLRGGGEDYRLAVYSFFVNHPDQKDREKYLKNYHGEYSGYHGGNDNRTYTSKGLSFSHGDLTQPYAKVELKWSVIIKRIDVLMSQDRFLSDRDREAMAGYEIRQLARSIHSFFIDAPELYPRPYQANAIADYWEGVEEVAEQLTNPNRVEEIYQMMLPLWEGTPQDDRHYQSRKTGLENMQAYRAGTYSVFNRAQTLRPLSSSAETPSAEPETPKPELPVTPAEEEQDNASQNEELEEAKQLINVYCLEVFDQEADFSDLSHVDLAFSSTSDSEHTVEIFADLVAFRLVYQVDGETVHEITCGSLSELNGYLANLDFDEMVAYADDRYQQEHADRGELAETESDTLTVERYLSDDESIVIQKYPNGQYHNRYGYNEQNGNAASTAGGFETLEEAENALLSHRPSAVKIAEPSKEHAEKEQSAVLAPPKSKRERVVFTTLHPEIPADQRRNFRITDSELGHGTRSEKYAANVAAIRTLKQIEAEERLATPEEQEILSRYVGWGGLADCFDERHGKYLELKSLLDENEYAAARASSLTAFYTSPVIIGAMYQALSQMGFRQGNILEPSCGVGNFIGMLPDSMADSKAYGVEIDSISGRIAQQLYQNSSIAVNGFEKVQMPDSFFDVAIGNVPFGDFKVRDKKYDKNHWLIHDYFFGKTLDKVRPGGVIAFITSKGTMDKENSAVRKYLAQRADLIGAIRLPNNAFKANAGTEVTSDIIFLQKRDRMTDIEPDWVHLDTDENGIRMNRYFVQHPEMILGDMVMESTRFGMDSTCRAYEDADLSELLSEAVQNLHAQITDYEVEELDEEEDRSIPADPAVRNFSFCLVDGKVYYRENSRMHPIEVSVTAENRIRGMITIRECVRRLIEYQTEGYPDEDIQKEQSELNRLYDDYTKKYGLLSSRGNSLAFGEDASYCLLCSLEVLDEEGNLKRKADMFTKRTIRPHEAVTSVDTASEALAVSISEKARVDMEYMAELSGKSEEELAADLSGVIFRDIQCAEEAAAIPKAFVQVEQFPFVAADEYLSGNVRRKLRMAKALYEVLPDEKKPLIAKNIEALEAVQPVDLTAAEIGVRIGANWIPIDVYQKFMVETFGTSYYAGSRIKILRSGATGQWAITEKNADRGNIKTLTTYGTKRMNAYQILEQTLNQRDVRVFDYVEDENGNKKPVLNKKETAIAQDRQELIKQKFSEWIWKDIDRRERLCRIYNETFNSIRPREYDGSHIRFSGMNPEITLRPHQVNAIAHIMYGGNTLLAHEVGAGKTFEMVAAAMEMKRLGLCTKSLIVVPNHITEQWAAEWLQLYPSANILVATKKDFETQNRKKFCARIATGDYDAVIIGHSQFEKIPMSAERQVAILQQQIDEIMFGIEEAKSAKAERYTVKQLERTRKSLEAKLERLNDQSRKDNLVTFEELGVDRVFVDESHYFKNLFLATKMRNVGGIAQTEAQKSSDLFMKCRYLDEITGGRGVIFATGTPISNSMVELYTIQRYLQYDTLQEMGLIHFDDWASDFGETITAIELSPEGSGYRAKTRFAKFFNLPELMATFKQVADIQTADMLKLPVPKANFHTEVIQPSELQQEMVRGLAERAEAIRAGGVDPRVDNMLRITNDGRKLALDMRLINPLAADDPNGKVATCARNVIRIWEQTKEQRSAQLVFCDLSTPKDDGSFSVYNDLKKKLMEAGIPEEEIAFIHDANTEARKKELFSKVRSGQVRILMGSTQKMGAGTNVQDRLIALHDLDCPWRPSDLAQRLGRLVRQGNQNPEVEIFRYVTEGTFDAYLYQLVENKQKFIAQIMTSKAPVRVADDVDETALSYSEIKALATGNPLIIEKCNLDMEVGKLNMLKASYLSQKYALEDMVLKKYPEAITRLTERIAGYEQDVQIAADHPKPQEGFVGITILDQPYADKEAAGKAILDVCTKMTGSDAVFLGQYRGFSLVLSYDGPSNEYRMTMKGTLSHTAVLGADVFGNLTRMDNVIDGLSGKLEAVRAELADTQVQLENARTELVAPFAREAELAEKTARLKELNILLNMDQKDKSLIDDVPDEDTPERPRSKGMER